MFARLFGKPEPAKKAFRRNLDPERLSRFSHAHARPDVANSLAEQSPSALLTHSVPPEIEAIPVINLPNQLYSDAPIPVEVLRRSLPERYRELILENGTVN